VSERRHGPLLPGFKEMAERRRRLAEELVDRRRALGLSQTEVAARMGTSQSAVARLESGELDVRLSTIERYAAAIGQDVAIVLSDRSSGGAGKGRP
jgi:predicted transcriptional regulator